MPEYKSTAEALIAVMRLVPVVKKESRNEQQRFSFRGIDDVLNAVGPALREVGVLVYPKLLETNRNMITSASGKPMQHVVVEVEYHFVFPGTGDGITVVTPGEAFDAGDKVVSKAMSVAFRTALIQTLSLPTDEPDPDSQTYEVGATRAAVPGRGDTDPQVLINQIGTIAQEKGLDLDEIRSSWAKGHDGEDITSATDVPGLRDVLAGVRRA